MLFAPYPIVVAVEVPAIARLATPDGCSAGRPRSSAINVVDFARPGPIFRRFTGLPAMTMPVAILAVVVASVGRQSTGMRSDWRSEKNPQSR